MAHLSLSFASAEVSGDGEIRQLQKAMHGWPNITGWYFKLDVRQMPILYPERGFKGKRIFFHRMEVEYINTISRGAFLDLCSNGLDSRYVLLVNRQETLMALQTMLPELPEQIGNWFHRWKLELLLRYAINGIVYNPQRAILLVNHG